MILDINPHNILVSDSSISCHLTHNCGQNSESQINIFSIITMPIVLTLNPVELDIGPHNLSVFDFSISGYVTQKLVAQNQNTE